MNWYATSILSLIFFSLQYFVYKIATEKKANTELVTLFLVITVTAVGFVYFILAHPALINLRNLLFLSLVAGVTFILATLFRFESLKHIPSSIAFFVFDFKVLTISLVSILYFKDQITRLQLFGIIVALCAALIVIKKQPGEQAQYKNFNLGIIFALGVVLALTFNSLAIKKGALTYNPWVFIFFEGVLSSIFSFALYKVRAVNQVHERSKYFSAGIGIIVGILNFLAFYFEFTSLKTGPLAVVTAIISFSTIGAIILSSITYKEKVGVKRVVGLILGFLSLLLLR